MADTFQLHSLSSLVSISHLCSVWDLVQSFMFLSWMNFNCQPTVRVINALDNIHAGPQHQDLCASESGSTVFCSHWNANLPGLRLERKILKLAILEHKSRQNKLLFDCLWLWLCMWCFCSWSAGCFFWWIGYVDYSELIIIYLFCCATMFHEFAKYISTSQ